MDNLDSPTPPSQVNDKKHFKSDQINNRPDAPWKSDDIKFGRMLDKRAGLGLLINLLLSISMVLFKHDSLFRSFYQRLFDVMAIRLQTNLISAQIKTRILFVAWLR